MTGIYGAWRFLHFDRAAVQYIDASLDGVWKSFYAALVILPAVIVLRVLLVAANPDTFADAQTSRIAIVFALDYVFQWVVFPLVMFYIAETMGRSRQYASFIVARNWSHTIQLMIIFPPALLVLMTNTEGPGLPEMFLLVAHVATWVYGWFIARTVLDISNLAAALIVLTDLVISLLITISSEILIAAV
jgi:hypothetical protein